MYYFNLIVNIIINKINVTNGNHPIIDKVNYLANFYVRLGYELL